VGAAGGTYPAVYNAANEVAVDAFHDGEIGFLDIVDTVDRVVQEHTGSDSASLGVEDVMRADQWARERARKVLGLASHKAGAAGASEVATAGSVVSHGEGPA
jgi:1-deoxy-D-xylulose-5-phosphate reductoisomerase